MKVFLVFCCCFFIYLNQNGVNGFGLFDKLAKTEQKVKHDVENFLGIHKNEPQDKPNENVHDGNPDVKQQNPVVEKGSQDVKKESNEAEKVNQNVNETKTKDSATSTPQTKTESTTVASLENTTAPSTTAPSTTAPSTTAPSTTIVTPKEGEVTVAPSTSTTDVGDGREGLRADSCAQGKVMSEGRCVTKEDFP